MENDVLRELSWRGLLHQRTAEEALDEHLAVPGRVGYCGFDPTADSLTIGNLVPLTMLIHWQRAGHRPIALIGGGTGLIGDPSGKDHERPLLTREQVEANIAGQRRIFERLLEVDARAPTGALLLSNAEWLEKVGFIDFLRQVGKHVSVKAMLQKESVRERLHNRDQGISYAEFSYMLLQAYDFLHLRRELGCTLQMAGSDQYGNLTAGIDLIHRTLGHATEAFGITSPLVTHADGHKVGKSERGAVWLTADRTSPYAFLQYWVNVPDADVGAFLRWFTLFPREEVEELEARHSVARDERIAQRALARHLTDRLHGADERRRAESASEALFGRGDLRALDANALAAVYADLPHSRHEPDALSGAGLALVDLLPSTSLAASRREARELLARGAVSVNGLRVPADHRLTRADLLPGGFVLIRKGRRHWHGTRWDFTDPA
jgi:tyrosyl-tRNA synthetase